MNHRITWAAAAATLLTSTALYSLFAGWSWFWAGAGAVATAAGVGTLTRLRRLPVGVCLAAGWAGVLVYLNVVFAAARSWLLVVPTPGSLAYLWRLAGQGVVEAAGYAPPVPVRPGVVLLAAGGIGAVAVVTDLLAVRLRVPAAAGLPLLALFGVPAATAASRGGAGAGVVFCLAAAGYLALLGADSRDRIRLWGPIVSVRRRGVPTTRGLTAAGRRLAVASVVAAIGVPLLLPGLGSSRLFAVRLGAGESGGHRTALLPGPLVGMNTDLRQSQPTPVLTYRTTDLTPQYLQVYVLDRLTDTNWTMSLTPGTGVTNRTLPRPPGLTDAAGYQVTTSITLSPTADTGGSVSFLPLPYPATRVTVPGRWMVDPGTGMMYSSGTRLGGLRYTVVSDNVDPTPEQLADAPPPPASIRRRYLSVPAAFRSLKPLAEQVTKGATTAYAKAIALQQWFTQTGGFTYSLDTPEPNGPGALRRFLTVTKRGYCQQFAFAMAVLARLLGIPSRVAVGFTSGTPLGNDTWLVQTSDAHAWPELYFQGAGWLRFEPTPSGVGGQDTAYPPAYTLPALSPGSSGNAGPPGVGDQTIRPGTAGTGARTPPLARRLPGSGSAAGSSGAGSGSTDDLGIVLGVVAAALAAVALGGPRACRSLIRWRRWALADGRPWPVSLPRRVPTPRRSVDRPEGSGDAVDRAAGHRECDVRRAHTAWREFLDDLTDYRIDHRASDSPRATMQRIAERLGWSGAVFEALTRIAMAEEHASYARRPVESTTLRSDSVLLRRALAVSVGRWTRMRCWVFPASVLVQLRDDAERLWGRLDTLSVPLHRSHGTEKPAL